MQKLDRTDKKILKILQNDGRITTKELAQKLHLTNTPVYERVKKLEKNGIIKQYSAVLDPHSIDRSLIIFLTVSIKSHKKSVVEEFKEAALALPEVMEFYYISGNFDSLIKVMVKDMEEYKTFIEDKLSTLEHINQFQSSFVISGANKIAFEI